MNGNEFNTATKSKPLAKAPLLTRILQFIKRKLQRK